MLHPKLVSGDIRTREPAPPEHASCRGVRLFLSHVEMFVSGVRCVGCVFKADESMVSMRPMEHMVRNCTNWRE